MKARDIMTVNPLCVTPTDTVRRAADIMREMNIGAVPVIEDRVDRKLCGIVTDRDIVVRCTSAAHSPLCIVGSHMTPMPLQTVWLDDDVSDVVERMEMAQVRRIPVVSPDGSLLGIIAMADVARRIGPVSPRTVDEVLERVSAASVPLATPAFIDGDFID